MVRGLKKKLLIGLLSAAVVGTSLAPSVPLVGSFAQEVKAAPGDTVVADDGTVYEEVKTVEAEEGVAAHWSETGDIYKVDGNDYIKQTEIPTGTGGTYKKITATPVTEPSDSAIGTYYEEINNGYKKTEDNSVTVGKTYYTVSEGEDVTFVPATNATLPGDLTGLYVKTGNDNTFIEAKKLVNITGGASYTLYSKKTGYSSATIKQSTNADTKGYSVKEKDTKVALEKNKDETVKVTVTAGAGKVIKNVIAKILDSSGNPKQTLTATATSEENVYQLTVKATEDVINLVIDAETEVLKITPTLDTSALSSKVGTASLTSSSAVEYGGKIELKVNLAEGRTSSDVNVTADAGTVSGPEKDGSVLTYKIDTTNVTKDSIKITVEGQLDNDDLDKEAKKDGSEATVTNASGKKVAADANQVLEAAKAGNEGKNVKAALKIEEKTDNDVNTALKNNVNSRLTLDTDLDIAGYFAIDLYRVVVDAGETIPAGDITTGQDAAKNKVTTLDSLLTVHYFLPSDAVGKKLYKVVRNHDGIGDITTTPNADGEYIEVDGNKLTLHVKNLSDFAVLYSKTDATTPYVPDPDPVPKPDPDPTPVKPDPTPVKPNPVKPSSDTGTKAAKATTSTKKSSKTSSPKTADYAVNSLLALLTGAAGLFGITLINKKRKEDEE